MSTLVNFISNEWAGLVDDLASLQDIITGKDSMDKSLHMYFLAAKRVEAHNFRVRALNTYKIIYETYG